LNLEFNQLTVVPTESFPVLSVNLQEVRLNFNPISTFPVVVFYLRYLKLADLRYTDISMDNVTALLTNISFTYLAESVVDSAASKNLLIH
jgi:Leucine-rich repeat (LRR) protein